MNNKYPKIDVANINITLIATMSVSRINESVIIAKNTNTAHTIDRSMYFKIAFSLFIIVVFKFVRSGESNPR